MVGIKHKFVSAVVDAGNADEVGPDEWNDDHSLSGTVAVALGGTGSSTTASAQQALALQPGVDIVGLEATGSASFGSAIRVSATASVGSLVVGGTSTLSGAVRALSSLDVSATLSVGGTTNLNNTLVAGTTTLSGNARALGNLSVSATISAGFANLRGQVWPAAGASGTILQTEAGGSLTWTAVAGTGDVTAAVVLTDNAVVRGDGGAKGVQDSGVILGDSDTLTGIAAITVNGSATFSGTVRALTALDVSATLSAGSLKVAGTSTLSGAVRALTTLDVSATASLGALQVAGTSSLSGAVQVLTTLGVSSSASVGGLVVTGTSTLSGAVRALTTLDVSATVSIGALQVAGTTTLSGAVRAMTTLDVSATLSAAALAGAIASSAVINTGTNNNLAVTADGLAGANIGVRGISIEVFGVTTNNATGTKKKIFSILAAMNGMNLISAHAEVATAGTTGTLTVDINKNGSSMLSTLLTVDTAETGSDTAATPVVINTAADDVATFDVISIDIDAIHTTPAQGLIVTLGFQLP